MQGPMFSVALHMEIVGGHVLRRKRIAGLIATALFVGCANEVTIEPTGSGSGTGGKGGSAGQGGVGGQGGEGGQGGSIMGNHGPGAQNIVSSGKVSTSANYKLVWTMGQSTQNQSKMSTTKFQLQGGLVGANGSVP
jgi:hypothetical protein